jgi:hypothetical protein
MVVQREVTRYLALLPKKLKLNFDSMALESGRLKNVRKYSRFPCAKPNLQQFLNLRQKARALMERPQKGKFTPKA